MLLTFDDIYVIMAFMIERKKNKIDSRIHPENADNIYIQREKKNKIMA